MTWPDTDFTDSGHLTRVGPYMHFAGYPAARYPVQDWAGYRLYLAAQAGPEIVFADNFAARDRPDISITGYPAHVLGQILSLDQATPVLLYVQKVAPLFI